MVQHNLTLIDSARALKRRDRQTSFERRLVEEHAVSKDHLMRALVLRQHQRAPIDQILVSEGWASQEQVLDALSSQHGMQQVDLGGHRPQARLLARKPAQFWLRCCALPYMQLGQTVVVAIAHPAAFAGIKRDLEGSFADIQPVIASEAQINALLIAHFREDLAREASTRVPLAYSCRTLRQPTWFSWPLLFLVAAITAAILAPRLVFAVLCGLALLTLLLFTVLKCAGFLSHLQAQRSERELRRRQKHASSVGARVDHVPEMTPPRRLPHISMLVPLYKEAEIGRALLCRLCKLTYPRSLLEVLLVLEEDDAVTRNAIRCADLPDWFRVIEVPAHGGLTTKPRAMNYALNFCRGEIIGVWDAEDAPNPDQLEQVAQAFAQGDNNLACLQGALDYYNPSQNWIARCFTLEYASWFRIVLPGIARLGLVVPLGGTTLFIRKAVLEQLGGWDAHNVTEDADLGVRLSRLGYRTDMLPTTTYEEANCRPWPWVKQRSRWLKGFMVTYLVHMRRPTVLARQLGWRQFLGLQAFFLGTVGQFLLAPCLWSFWLITFGLSHPTAPVLPAGAPMVAAAALVFFELLGVVIAITAAFASGRRRLALWAPCMLLYFPMGVIAVYKALYELIFRPFFWDKTAHGHTPHTDAAQDTQPRIVPDL
ncbi:glycosyltransferase [Phaeobacter porticola]|uniref:Glycosyl transferase-like protein n=1 Tax=Phaeobacter porticola TaxID=1844006 RepID=A0A1L3I7J5_9RHOB|nr:glycosyltransferase [Phaeobacter porticola]APG48063.1 glycosyl transferase-like protein [Phaeobacter porticola]